MAFPAVASTSSGNSGGNATTHVMDLPSGVSSGDLLLLFVSVDATPTASITTPASGWTELVTGTQVSSNRLSVFYRIADGSEASTITITTSAGEATSYACYRITGHGSEVEASIAFNASTSDSPDPPSLAPSWLSEDTLWFAATSWDNGTISVSAYPANYSANQVTDRFNSGGGAGIAAASRELAASSEDPGAFTLSAGDGVVAFTVAVRPSGGGGGPTYTLTADTGAFSLTGNATGLLVSRLLTADNASYALTGIAAGLVASRRITADAGSYTLTGIDAGLTVSRLLVLATGTFSLAGSDANLISGTQLQADSGSFALTGNNAGLAVSRRLTAEVGALAITGNDATLDYSGAVGPTYTLTAETGTLSLTGSNTGLIASRRLTAETQSYTLTGNDATLFFAKVMEAATGAFALTGSDATFVVGRRLAADTGSFALTGNAANLNYSGATGSIAHFYYYTMLGA